MRSRALITRLSQLQLSAANYRAERERTSNSTADAVQVFPRMRKIFKKRGERGKSYGIAVEKEFERFETLAVTRKRCASVL